MAKIIASVLNADFSQKEKWLPELEEAGIDGIQWDIMDNKYVPNDGVEEKWISALREKTKLFFEAHLMVENPENYIEKMAIFGVNMVIFHLETTKEPLKLLEKIEEQGMKTGIAINNQTSAEKILPYLDKTDLALVMGVEAGFGGQKFNPLSLEKIKLIKKKIDEDSLECQIEVDGGVNKETGKKCVEAGCDVLIAGTGIFQHPKGIKEAVKELKEL